jgi:hypothetical protein
LFKIEKFLKNKHSHIYDIASIIFWEFRRVWAGKRRLRKGILGQPPRGDYGASRLLGEDLYLPANTFLDDGGWSYILYLAATVQETE